MRKYMTLAVAITSLVGTVAACGDDDDAAGGDDDGGTATVKFAPTDDGRSGSVDVALREYLVLPESTRHEGGTFDFNVRNDGPAHTHKLVVAKTDLPADDLPTNDDGSVDEEGAGIEVIGEVEALAVGAAATLRVDVGAGQYVLLCTIVEEVDGQMIVHYEQGMHTAFTVE